MENENLISEMNKLKDKNLISEMKTASPRMPSPLTAGITRLAFYLQML